MPAKAARGPRSRTDTIGPEDRVRPGLVAAIGLGAALLALAGYFVVQPPRKAHHGLTVSSDDGTPPPLAPLPLGAPAPRSSANPLSHAKTTMAILSEQGPDCLSCAETNGCLDENDHGNPCEGASGNATACGDGVTETEMCLRVLSEVFSTKCAETLQEVPCLCGKTDAEQCLSGAAAPQGPLYSDFACDFRTRDVHRMQDGFRDHRYGAGRANDLVQCIAGYDCKCFGR